VIQPDTRSLHRKVQTISGRGSRIRVGSYVEPCTLHCTSATGLKDSAVALSLPLVVPLNEPRRRAVAVRTSGLSFSCISLDVRYRQTLLDRPTNVTTLPLFVNAITSASPRFRQGIFKVTLFHAVVVLL